MFFKLRIILQKALYFCFQRRYVYHLITISLVWNTPLPARAQTQITPDGSLPTNINNNGGGVYEITGGGQPNKGTNLFHSLKDFSIKLGDTARFVHPQGIENIITRITGGLPSQINGTIQTLIEGTTDIGRANLFLINPSGIIFGENARLDIGGSFFATTADKLKFADGTEFIATNSTANPLLTISVPIGLQYGSNPNSSIRVNGNGHNLGFSFDSGYVDRSNRPLGLHYGTQTGKTIALVGANVVLDGGNITLPEGKVEIWSVKNGEVSLINNNQQLQLEPGQGINYSHIELLNAASIDTSGNSAGSIQLRGKNISLTNGSVIVTDTLGNGTSGTLNILASESVKIQGIVDNSNSQYYSGIFADVAPNATGDGSNITIESKSLQVIDGGQIQGATFGIGSAGDLYVKAADIQLVGDSRLAASGLASPVTPGATGNGGNLIIETENLRVLAGAQITTTTFGSGNAGDLTIKASDIEVKGVAEYTDIFTGESDENPSILAAAVEKVSGFPNSGIGQGGNVKIQTQNLRLVEGGQVVSATSSLGDAGNLQVNANNVELIGVSKTTRSGLFASAIQESGDGGNITVNANQLTIRDGATISVSNFQSQNKLPPGTGAAGSIQMNVLFLLMKQGTITADTNAGDFGNITIQSQNIVISQGSRMTTNALNSSLGGNLSISTNSLVAVENSDITANAQQGFGGRVAINAQGIFGSQVRQQQTLESDITASSELGLEFNGTVQVNTPGVDLSRGSVELPTTLTDPSQQIATGCPTAARNNSLVFSGRGGLPENPDNTLRGQTLWYDMRNLPDSQQAESQPQIINKQSHRTQIPDESIVEAKGWVMNSKGELELVAMVPLAIAGLPVPSCDGGDRG
ncbi:filamentous hemagglutinin N-terminal domain-containing protein [Scytonema sp. UIC 10036]|uniref:beta strand repeat-containing protein n=1 Tax=Scytonema sp. UIC 10036 TaxID=2304196 RepID=UPI0012DA17B5|nr:S-layer family protein [Scytonema sp. UIC 10036]MUG91656.1 filamentous hemagglutinin N-terminal domain-containing protein [Scytonema sp. UIC 10036]